MQERERKILVVEKINENSRYKKDYSAHKLVKNVEKTCFKKQ